ncbi:MAG: glycine-rich protein, partial [Bacilli bacterium]
GGSSFISGYAGVNAVTASSSLTHSNNTIHYSSKYFIDGTMEAGVNVGHGKAKITLIEEPKKINLSLNKVRYIKDCINGSNINTFNHWIELQAIKNGVNVAKDKNVIGSASLVDLNYPYSRAVDGDITASKYAGSNQSNSCITVDLGQVYDLDEIAVWHYYADGRTYNNNITSVSNNNTDWITVINKTEPETPNGKRVSAYSN